MTYWIDDLRNPSNYLQDKDVVWIKTYEEFVDKISNYPMPDVIWFDHDLGEGKNGKDCADFLVDFCMTKRKKLPEYHSQSQNPVGKENIIKLLDCYKKFEKDE